ncbi:MAG TPA: undecaprenyl-diphosphate phosphatase [Bacillota bacterium]|nr:undecaprenyl-diphosphate phosphatase [Bacillota bacterium]HOK68631.1 undecaprenyl-diphosphate phosphatase [Bacillota bacterium]HPP84743.1 undecaprenyl-diphosphate phosphatase [Bacillota bacterium]
MIYLEILKAIFFGIVEGITEWLPISSTGHLILFEEFIQLNASDEFIEMFRVVIQLGAILAVVVLYWNKLIPFAYRKESGMAIKKDTISMWLKIAVSCIPAVIAAKWDDEFEALFYNKVSISIALIVFGILFIVIEIYNKKREPKITQISQLTYTTALVIGLFQLIAAVFPGTSRSGATIVGALLIGVSRTVAAEYTFFLAVPVMFGASLLKIVKFGFSFSGTEIILLLTGVLVSFFISLIAIKFLIGYIKKHDFKVFGWYRIVLGAIVLIYCFIAR